MVTGITATFQTVKERIRINVGGLTESEQGVGALETDDLTATYLSVPLSQVLLCFPLWK